MRATPFYRILAIYAAALLVLPIWLAARQPIVRSTTSVLKSLGLALQIKRAYASLLDDSDTSFPVQDHEVMPFGTSVATAVASAVKGEQLCNHPACLAPLTRWRCWNVLAEAYYCVNCAEKLNAASGDAICKPPQPSTREVSR